MIHSVSREFAGSLEDIEIEALRDFFAAAPQKIADHLGVRLHQVGPVTLFMVPALDVLVFNRAVGYGLQLAIDPSDVDRYIDHFRAEGVKRFFVQLCPVGAPDGARRELQGRGIHWYNNWVKLHRDTSPPSPITPTFQTRLIDRSHALRFAEIVCYGFGWGSEGIDWVATLVGRPSWRVYGAFDGPHLVAGGALYVRDHYAWLGFAATDEAYRASGAQTGLLAKRINDAAILGAQTLVLETAEQTAEHSAPSFRNVQRLGFDVAYVRPNYLKVK